ncbi:cupin domain-containing protein [Tenacibaculum sp. 190524A02b]|uniref:cupin domain-containing protein n=1 Tax=Tenacibaculum vairaonense TaxID=3137860 RepID=UPI0031FA6E22
MRYKKSEFSNSVIKDRIEVIENSKHILRFRTFLEKGGGQNQLHYHTKINETFKVVQGELSVVLNKKESILKAGSSYTIPASTAHMFYNNSNEQVIFDVEILNPQKMIHGLKIMYGLANEGKINKEGLPKNIFYLTIALHMMDTFSPRIPYFIQKSGILILASLGKVLGIEKRLIEKYSV